MESQQKYTRRIVFTCIGLLLLAVGYLAWRGIQEKKEEERVSSSPAAQSVVDFPQLNPYAGETNPFETVETNPFRNVYQNPFQ